MTIRSWTLASGIALLAGSGALAAVDQEEKPAPAKEPVIAIFLGNTVCPVTGKPANRDIYAKVEGQRVHVSSADDVDAVTRDAAAMLAKAYPAPKPITNPACPCGKALAGKQGGQEGTAGAGDSSVVRFQGYTFRTCSANCATEATLDAVPIIAKLLHPTAKDVENTNDPIDDKPTDSYVMIKYRDHLIRLSKWANVPSFEKDPGKALEKLRIRGD